MKLKIIIHNSVSLDCSLTGFIPDMDLHYRIAGEYKPDAHLIGADTVFAGNEMFGETIPKEVSSDFIKPDRDPNLPRWIITDSGGRLQGMLHTCRRFEFCRDVIILVSDYTPDSYLKHPEARNYNYFIEGKEKVDLEKAINHLSINFKINTILTDTGRVLGNILLNLRLVDEISILIHPLFVGEKRYPMFSELKNNPEIKLKKSECFNNGCVWNVYDVIP